MPQTVDEDNASYGVAKNHMLRAYIPTNSQHLPTSRDGPFRMVYISRIISKSSIKLRTPNPNLNILASSNAAKPAFKTVTTTKTIF